MYNYGLSKEFKRNIMREIYIVQISSANYAGAPDHCAVMASSEDEAMDLARPYAEQYYYEQDSEQWLDENDNEEAEEYSTVDYAVPLVGSEYEEYYANEVQRNAFYPMVAE